MWEFNEVIDVKYRGKYIYSIKFDDGVEGDIDFSEYLSRGPVFQFSVPPLQQPGIGEWVGADESAHSGCYTHVVRMNPHLHRSSNEKGLHSNEIIKLSLKLPDGPLDF